MFQLITYLVRCRDETLLLVFEPAFSPLILYFDKMNLIKWQGKISIQRLFDG
jgi:hypothetical protein